MRGPEQQVSAGGGSRRAGPARRRPAKGGSARQLAFSFDALADAFGRAADRAAASGSAREVSAPTEASSGPRSMAVGLRAAPASGEARDDDAVRARIAGSMAKLLGVAVEVELTRNRRTMISTARAGSALRVRLHRMFVEADREIVEALGRYVKSGDRRASRALGDFIEEKRDRFVAPRPRPALRTRGDHHDLEEIFGAVERAWFPGGVEGVGITWGRRGAAGRGRRRKRSIRLGTYTHDERLVRVHPVLDQSWVPRFFVQYIVFHELLHHVEPAREEEGRTIFHTAEFRRREQAYPDYERALAWERANISKLLAS